MIARLFDRRGFIFAGGAFAAMPAFAGLISAPPGRSLGFHVTRKGSVIGTHMLSFEGQGDDLTVRVAVDLAVGFGPITVFRYTHRATEVWQNGRVVSLDTTTNDDGTRHTVTARRTDAGLVVEGTKAARYTAPDSALPATHWNRKMLDGPMINTQDGRLMRPTVQAVGTDAIPTAGGGTIVASHFAMSGDALLDTWYDASSNWAGICFKAGDGSVVRYERV
jgi:hypothetical protein